jgi:hypothetical protein
MPLGSAWLYSELMRWPRRSISVSSWADNPHFRREIPGELVEVEPACLPQGDGLVGGGEQPAGVVDAQARAAGAADKSR